ncbi:hypothetical protein V2J09_008158 [Rumex salicifolius]
MMKTVSIPNCYVSSIDLRQELGGIVTIITHPKILDYSDWCARRSADKSKGHGNLLTVKHYRRVWLITSLLELPDHLMKHHISNSGYITPPLRQCIDCSKALSPKPFIPYPAINAFHMQCESTFQDQVLQIPHKVKGG